MSHCDVTSIVSDIISSLGRMCYTDSCSIYYRLLVLPSPGNSTVIAYKAFTIYQRIMFLKVCISLSV